MEEFYCGPKHAPKWIKKLLSSKFNTSCKIHDNQYKKASKYTRREADKLFLQNMLTEASNSKYWTLAAYLYYYIVKLWGWYYYKGNDKC